MAKYGVEDIDRGWGFIMKQVKELESSKVDIGVQSGSGSENGLDIAQLAAIHEFGKMIDVPPRHTKTYWKVKKNGDLKKGFAKKSKANFEMRHQVRGYTIKIPARPFMRRTFDVGKGEIIQYISKAFDRLLKRSLSAPQLLQLVGQKYERMTKQKLTEGPWAPNAPSTVKKKKSNRPLIDTGRLRASIRYIIKR